jgi:CBS domain-containing protein
MQVDNILQSKGRAVITVTARSTIAEAVDKLNANRIGAVVVVDGNHVIGILSERDVVRRLGKDWSALATRPVSDLMTKAVVTTTRTAPVAELMEQMTEHRIRHIPVVDGGNLIGIVSIGDVVKGKIEETEREATALKEYIAS